MSTCEDCGTENLTDAQYDAHAGGMCAHALSQLDI